MQHDTRVKYSGLEQVFLNATRSLMDAQFLHIFYILYISHPPLLYLNDVIESTDVFVADSNKYNTMTFDHININTKNCTLGLFPAVDICRHTRSTGITVSP